MVLQQEMNKISVFYWNDAVQLKKLLSFGNGEITPFRVPACQSVPWKHGIWLHFSSY